MHKQIPRYGYQFIICPICNAKTFDYTSYSEYGWGTVEQHGYCDRCGYIIEQAYSPAYEAFFDIKKGFKDYYGKYHSKNAKRHKRVRRKLDTKGLEVNPLWVYYV